ncbi:MAG: GNAT family N-acetyltransferase [Limisphaerales bacterium]
MAIELLDDKKLWDQFVENSPQGTLFHTWDALKIAERHSRFQLLPYAVFLDNKLRCIFPFFVTRRLGLTIMCSPPPDSHIPYLGFAFDPSVAGLRAHKKERIFQQVTDEVCREIDKIAPNFVTFETVPNLIDLRTFAWKDHSVTLHYTYVIDLEKPLEEIWSGFSRRCKQDIKRVSTLSPHVEHTNDLSSMLGMWRERRKERGQKENLFSDSYLEELVAAFPQRMTVHSVSIDGRIAGAIACCVLREDQYAYWMVGVNVRRDLKINEFLIWEIVQHAKSHGFKTLDLIGAEPRGLSRFKSKFDPVLEPFCAVDKADALGKMASFVYFKFPKLQANLWRSGHESRGGFFGQKED